MGWATKTHKEWQYTRSTRADTKGTDGMDHKDTKRVAVHKRHKSGHKKHKGDECLVKCDQALPSGLIDLIYFEANYDKL
jgi:hypothetical protein